jgi:hypothetical protein
VHALRIVVTVTPNLLKAFVTKNRTSWNRPKWNSGFLAALRTVDGRLDVDRSRNERPRKRQDAFFVSAVLAAFRFVLETVVSKKLLLANGEDEFRAAEFAHEPLVVRHHTPAAREAFSKRFGRVRRHTSSSRLSADVCRGGLIPGIPAP